MALLPDQIDDFVNLTTNLFKKNKWTDLSLEYTEYIASEIIDDKKVVEDGGTKIEWQIKHKNTGNARNTGLYAQDQTRVEDVTVSATCGWAMQTTNFSYDIYEDLWQSDTETIIKILKLREHDALSDMAELNEENLWSEPSSSSDTRPYGIPFWIRQETSASTGAFSGGNPTATGLTGGCGGVSSTTYPRWRNWTFTYTSPSIDDLVVKIKKALYSTQFRAPVPHAETGFGTTNNYNIFTTYAVREPLERVAESRNDNLGKDVAKYINQVTVGGVPIRAVPYLDDNTSDDPVYGVNWNVFRPYVKRGCNMRRNPPKEAARQHTVREVHYDNSCQYICYNRRKTFVGATS